MQSFEEVGEIVCVAADKQHDNLQEKLTAKGQITKCYKKDGLALIDIEISAENQDSVKVMSGHATCVLWENSKKEKASNTTLPPVSEAYAAEFDGHCKMLTKKKRSTSEATSVN